ncbi:MAG: adenylate/guanylate cyclase domain-containing protein, partial [Actinomycetota bacterium]|nr:adenylate/guanylate cyclase domain-containing protein [Actinomycetota bacterium]
PNRGTVRVTLNCPLAVLLALRDRTAEAQACLQLAGSVARSLGYAEAEVFIPLFSATVAALAGQPGEAESLLRTALRACDRLGEVGLVAAVARDLARNLLDRGVWDEPQALTGSMIVPLAPSEAADQLGVRARIEALRGNPALAAELAGRAAVEAARTDSPISRGIAELDRAQVLRAQRQFVAGRQAAIAAGGWFEHKGHLVGSRQATELADLIAAEGALR